MRESERSAVTCLGRFGETASETLPVSQPASQEERQRSQDNPPERCLQPAVPGRQARKSNTDQCIKQSVSQDPSAVSMENTVRWQAPDGSERYVVSGTVRARARTQDSLARMVLWA